MQDIFIEGGFNALFTAQEILDKGIVFLDQEVKDQFGITEGAAQMGVDLHSISIHRVIGTGFIPKEGKTVVAETELVEPIARPELNGRKVWMLSPGDYEVGLAEGCNIPLNGAGEIRHRSSLRRNGATLISPLWDPGFHTERMATFMHCNLPITIEVGARVGQMVIYQSAKEARAYMGQYQGCSTRAEDKASGKLKGDNTYA